MKLLFRIIFLIWIIIPITSCSKRHEAHEDKIITDLNEVFDPNHEGNTDWNYTEIDKDWLDDVGLYYDYNIGAYRQKQSYQEQDKQYNRKPMNPITTFIILTAIFVIFFEIWLLYATYQIANNKHRIMWIWLFNSLIGGIGNFVILSLSKSLKHNKDLDIREEPDLLGTTIALGNATILIILCLLYRLYLIIAGNPEVLKDFF